VLSLQFCLVDCRSVRHGHFLYRYKKCYRRTVCSKRGLGYEFGYQALPRGPDSSSRAWKVFLEGAPDGKLDMTGEEFAEADDWAME
jgi:hypothetical protein